MLGKETWRGRHLARVTQCCMVMLDECRTLCGWFENCGGETRRVMSCPKRWIQGMVDVGGQSQGIKPEVSAVKWN